MILDIVKKGEFAGENREISPFAAGSNPTPGATKKIILTNKHKFTPFSANNVKIEFFSF
jgi:hypothetical protein